MKMMILKNNKILYISLHRPEIDPGVENKIKGFCSAAERKGFEVERITQYCTKIGERRTVLNKALQSDAKTVIIRSFGSLTIVINDILRKARREGRIVICDQPSPLSTTINEIWNSDKSALKRIYNIAWSLISGPWGMWPYHRIIEYAPEGNFFSLGNKDTIRVIGNGIDINRIGLRDYDGGIDNEIRLLGVANTANHHGFDRLLRAMAQLSGGNLKVTLKIIGGKLDSPIVIRLKELSKELNIKNNVEFCGFQNADFISKEYNRSDLAIGALGLHRNGLKTASILKAREYCLAGIPFMTAGADPDFPTDVPFRFEVANDESIESIVEVLRNFHEKRKNFTDEEIRQYALDNFSFDKKFDKMMEGLI